MMKSLLLAMVLLSGALSMVGCETTHGAGKDLEHAGEHIQDAAHDATH